MRDARPLVVSLLAVGATVTWRVGEFLHRGHRPRCPHKGADEHRCARSLRLRPSRITPPVRGADTRLCWLIPRCVVVRGVGCWVVPTVLRPDAPRCSTRHQPVHAAGRLYPAKTVLADLISAMAAVALLAGGTGLSSVVTEGRLRGGVPPLYPNELTLLCGSVVVLLVWRGSHDRPHKWDAPMTGLLLAMVWLSGSRTGLVMLILAVLLLLLQARTVPVPVFVTLVLAVPAVFYVIAGTDLISQFATRDDPGSALTLNSRTVAWSAASTHQKMYGTPTSVVGSQSRRSLFRPVPNRSGRGQQLGFVSCPSRAYRLADPRSLGQHHDRCDKEDQRRVPASLYGTAAFRGRPEFSGDRPRRRQRFVHAPLVYLPRRRSGAPDRSRRPSLRSRALHRSCALNAAATLNGRPTS